MSRPRNFKVHVGPPRRRAHSRRGLAAFLAIWGIELREWLHKHPHAPIERH